MHDQPDLSSSRLDGERIVTRAEAIGLAPERVRRALGLAGVAREATVQAPLRPRRRLLRRSARSSSA